MFLNISEYFLALFHHENVSLRNPYSYVHVYYVYMTIFKVVMNYIYSI